MPRSCGQLPFNDFGVDILNETESATESGIGDEKDITEVVVAAHKRNIDSVNGAKASAFYYSIAETAKANGLKPYGYMRYLISELIRYPRGSVPDEELEALMPWSDSLPEICYKK